jgi:hypothetical protein
LSGLSGAEHDTAGCKECPTWEVTKALADALDPTGTAAARLLPLWNSRHAAAAPWRRTGPVLLTRRVPDGTAAAAPFLEPCGDRFRVGPGFPAQPGGLTGEPLVQLPLVRALEHPGDLGEQVSPAAISRSAPTAAASSAALSSRHLAQCLACPASRATRIRSASRLTE